jgi:hypothetical protein
MTMRMILFAITILDALTDAIPTITYPLSSQVPPVARLSKPFSYTFSALTFSSDLPITYTLSAAPSWLFLDSSTRTFSGIPTINDIGAGTITVVDVELTASDQSGSVNLNSTFVISRSPAPVINIPLSSQLPSFGTSSAPSTLLLHPSAPFQFKFEPGTFSEIGSNRSLFYYAITSANTPLPSWLNFDATTLSFSGQSPTYVSLIQLPRTFGIQMIASDVEGFSGSSISFQIEIGIHTLAFSKQNMAINATAGADMSFNDLSSYLELDGNPTDISSFTSITAQTPTWITFDNYTLALSGHAPVDAKPCNITVYATDIYGDSATATILVDIQHLALSTAITSASPYPTSSPVPAMVAPHEHFPKSFVAAIVIPVLFLLLVILFAILCYRLRRSAACQPHRIPFENEKFIFQASSSAGEIIRLASTDSYKPPQLDTFENINQGWQSPRMSDHSLGETMASAGFAMRQSPPVSCPPAHVSWECDICENRTRQNSENAIPITELSWETTLSSACPTFSFGSQMNSSERIPNNNSPCSERRQARQSRQIWPSNLIRRPRYILSYGQLAAESILNSRDSNISFAALINFPILSESLNNQETAEVVPSAQNLNPTRQMRRRSRSAPSAERVSSGIIYGRSQSISSFARVDLNGRQAGHGQGLARKSTSWLTMNATYEQSRPSSSTNLTAAAESLHLGEVARDIHRSETSLTCRPISRRPGSSPFFSALTTRNSRQLPVKVVASSADSVTYSEEPMSALDPAISQSSAENRTIPDSFETSFWSAREGTRQLGAIVQNLLRRTWTQDSIRSNESSDSLFEQVGGSMSSMHQLHGINNINDAKGKKGDAEQEHKNYLPYDDTKWDSGTHYMQQGSQGSLVEYGTEDSRVPEFAMLAAGQPNLDASRLDMNLDNSMI